MHVTATTTGTLTGVDGRFTLAAVNAGTVSLTVRRLGYAPRTVTGLVVAAGIGAERSGARTAPDHVAAQTGRCAPTPA